MRGVLLDLDGVLYVGDEAVPGAAETVRWLQKEHVPHLFVTNTSSRPRAGVVEKLAGLGIDVEPDEVLTPAVAALSWLRASCPGPPVLFVPEGARVRRARPAAGRRGDGRRERRRRRPGIWMGLRHAEPRVPAAHGGAAPGAGGTGHDAVLAGTGRATAGHRSVRTGAGVRVRCGCGRHGKARPCVLPPRAAGSRPA